MIHKGTYDGTIYHNPANRFCIISVKTADKEVPLEARSTRRYRDHLIRFVATGYELPRTDAVELELDGEWKQGKYGMQFQVEQWRQIVPRTKSGVEGYLASGLIKGIGPATATLIVGFCQTVKTKPTPNLAFQPVGVGIACQIGSKTLRPVVQQPVFGANA